VVEKGCPLSIEVSAEVGTALEYLPGQEHRPRPQDALPDLGAHELVASGVGN
jgi:hypothetical protein